MVLQYIYALIYAFLYVITLMVVFFWTVLGEILHVDRYWINLEAY